MGILVGMGTEKRTSRASILTLKEACHEFSEALGWGTDDILQVEARKSFEMLFGWDKHDEKDGANISASVNDLYAATKDARGVARLIVCAVELNSTELLTESGRICRDGKTPEADLTYLLRLIPTNAGELPRSLVKVQGEKAKRRWNGKKAESIWQIEDRNVLSDGLLYYFHYLSELGADISGARKKRDSIYYSVVSLVLTILLVSWSRYLPVWARLTISVPVVGLLFTMIIGYVATKHVVAGLKVVQGESGDKTARKLSGFRWSFYGPICLSIVCIMFGPMNQYFAWVDKSGVISAWILFAHAALAAFALCNLARLDHYVARNDLSFSDSDRFGRILYYADLPAVVALTAFSFFVGIGIRINPNNSFRGERLEALVLGAVTLLLFSSNIAVAMVDDHRGPRRCREFGRNARRTFPLDK